MLTDSDKIVRHFSQAKGKVVERGWKAWHCHSLFWSTTKWSVLVLNQLFPKRVVFCALEADRNNDIALVLKVWKNLYKRYCFKLITRPKIFFWSEKMNLSLLKWKPHQVLSFTCSLFFIRHLFESWMPVREHIY